ncbi:uncharacterized protein LOC17881393 [Capsella rubella]|uniref:uncharacterized protein LOC17881393 n=1 Tax=Capsella rubella TaxID=81985 RepID=UPI000CD4DD30|nr:uncharacterized protein LOC17881393 [Capsella rubella]
MTTEGDARVLGGGEQDATMVDCEEKGRPPGDPPDRSWVQKVVGSVGGGLPVLWRSRGSDGYEWDVYKVYDCEGVRQTCFSPGVDSEAERIIRFEKEEEFLAALTGGPWRVFGSHLTVQAWVWKADKGLPQYVVRARFARICVEVDLTRPLKETVMVNDERYYVAYEGLMNICSGCGMYGHLVHACPHGAKDKSIVDPRRRKAVPLANKAMNTVGEVDKGGVSHRQSLGNEKVPVVTISNNFGDLEVDMESEGLRQEGDIREENKENEIIPNQNINGDDGVQGKLVVFGMTEATKASGPSGGCKEIRTGPNKNVVGNGLRPNLPKLAKPTRGLVFGLVRGELQMSVKGKRLRMDKGTVGRPGAIFETHAAGDRASRICHGLGFENSFRVDAARQSGGLWLLWRNGIGTVDVVHLTKQFIHATVVNGTEMVNVIVVYAVPSASRRSGLWISLSHVIRGAMVWW